MIRPFLVAAVIVLGLSCGERNQSPESIPDSAANKTDSTAEVSTPYFPVYDFLRNEIEYVDSLPVGIMKFRTLGKVKDSGYIQLDEFHAMTREFLLPEINDSSFIKLFKETSFVDKSNGNATFYYRSEDPSTQIRRVDVVTMKGQVYDEVKSLYIEKNTQLADTFMTRKLYWKPKRNFQLVTVKTTNSGKPQNELIKVVWDNRE